MDPINNQPPADPGAPQDPLNSASPIAGQPAEETPLDFGADAPPASQPAPAPENQPTPTAEPAAESNPYAANQSSPVLADTSQPNGADYGMPNNAAAPPANPAAPAPNPTGAYPPPAPKSHAGRTIILILAILIVMGVIGVLVYLFVLPKTSTTNTTSTATPTTATTVTPSETAGSSADVSSYYDSATAIKPTSTKGQAVDADLYPILKQDFSNNVKLTTDDGQMLTYVVNRTMTTDDLTAVQKALEAVGYTISDASGQQITATKAGQANVISFGMDDQTKAVITVTF